MPYKRYEIIKKRYLASKIAEYTIYAPLVARHCEAGQFIILRTDDDGERVPFTICDYDRELGTARILVQEVGYTTARLGMMREGDSLRDFVGPLGTPTNLDGYKNVCLVGGGIGGAVIYPQAKRLREEGRSADIILGARTADLLIYKDEFVKAARSARFVTDDGSNGNKGLVTDELASLIDGGAGYDLVFAVGPLAMMRAVCDLTRRYGIKTIVSMNSLMVDGTGMCGCCRLTVDGKTRYACVDGPEFDGHKVDFEEAIVRSRMYLKEEEEHYCRLRERYEKR